METITPIEIDNVVKSFCLSISKESSPVYLDFESEPDAIGLYCTENVERKIQRNGGKVQYGWQIAITEPFMIEAQFHAVWVGKDNKMHDITPRQVVGMDKILFLPDSKIKYEGKQINNIRKALVEDKLVNDFIGVWDRHFEATNRGNLALNNTAIILSDLSTEHANEIKILEMEKVRLLSIICSKYY